MVKKVLNNYDRFAPRWTIFAVDMSIIAITFFMAYFIRFNLTLNFDIEMLLVQFPLLVITAAISFLYTRSYKGVVRHTGFKDLTTIFNAILLLALLNIALVSINKVTHTIAGYTIPKSIIIIHSLLSFVALSSYRLLFSLYIRLFLLKRKHLKMF